MPELSAQDRKHLADLEPKLELIRDRVGSVARQLTTGFYLWGEGGTSKSFTVIEELKHLKADFIPHNSRLTGRGLFDTLSHFPTSTHLIEDCETLLDDKRAVGVLRSALWSQSRKRPPERDITWQAYRINLHFTFTGAIIMVANKPIEDIPELNAMKTRIAALQLVASFNEIAALMRQVSLEGFSYGDDYLSPDQCLEVAEFIIERTAELKKSLDMRLLINGFKDYIQNRSGQSKTHWQDLIASRLTQTTAVRIRRKDEMTAERRIALEINNAKVGEKEKETLWREQTKSEHRPEGKSMRAYYRRLSEQD